MKKLFTLFFALCVGAFASSATAAVGDVNADGSVNVSDVTALVNQIIGSGTYSAQACDVNADGEVNVSDVTALVNLIINGGGESEFKNQTFTVKGVSFDMIAVEGGTFTMGATEEQGSDADENESPTHRVTLSSYYIGQTEVTQELWQAVMGSNPSRFSGTNLPVEQVTWDDCQEFIHKLNALTGQNFRMPTEAEWEFAARGGNNGHGYKYSGSNNADDVAWHAFISSKTTHPVATKAPNELGIYDMSGNVEEWCSDCFGDYSSADQTNPTGPTSGSYRVIRGGSWFYAQSYSRVSMRTRALPDDYGYILGLRLALPLPLPFDENPTFTVNGVSFEMVTVVGDNFTMGGTKEQGSDVFDDEIPAHRVALSSYYIGKTEVTQELWQAVMGSNPSYFSGTNLPVEQVSWEDCQTFISKLNVLTGKKFRLPTEAEWEYAARGGNKSQGYKYSGSNTLDDVAWYKANSGKTTHPVATKAPNELGIYDMSGNVIEWCSDWYSGIYYSSSEQTNPTGPENGADRVHRGGYWGYISKYCRVSDRGGSSPGSAAASLGLRLVLTLDTSPTFNVNVNGVSFDMIAVEGGTFTMGATEEQVSDASSDEKPAHKVTLSSYYIGKTEVTQALWEAVMGSNPSSSRGANFPVDMVSWNDCQEFITKLNALTGKKFRLPTEAEWEYAARGGNKSQGYKYSGSNTIDDVAWYASNSGWKLKEVATKASNELSIYDMSGNVWEWCSDWYSGSYYSSSEQTNPTGPKTGTNRVIRGGGAASSQPNSNRVSTRSNNPPEVGGSHIGLRLAL